MPPIKVHKPNGGNNLKSNPKETKQHICKVEL
jgi:hypothetical protein